MEMTNCPRCGKIFTKMRSPICDVCAKEEEKMYEDVKKFLEENPNSMMHDIIEATGVSHKKILRYIREGRLEATSCLGGVHCEKCGRPIKIGRYCESCIISINQDVADLMNAKRYDGPRMHTSPKNE